MKRLPLIEARHLHHAYDYELFKDISLTVNEKDKVAVVGKSGSGKSTLLHILSTLLKPNRGEVKLFGQEIYSLPPNQLIQIRREKIGIVFQFHYLFKGFSALENLEVAALLSKQQIDRNLLERFGIAHLMQKRVTELSGGEQQRVSIARVLTKKPKIIFADEPTGNLDKNTANEVMNVLLEYVESKNAALFLVTHDRDLAKRCDRVYKLVDKKLLQESQAQGLASF